MTKFSLILSPLTSYPVSFPDQYLLNLTWTRSPVLYCQRCQQSICSQASHINNYTFARQSISFMSVLQNKIMQRLSSFNFPSRMYYSRCFVVLFVVVVVVFVVFTPKGPQAQNLLKALRSTSSRAKSMPQRPQV